MMKAIFAKDVKVGDVIVLSEEDRRSAVGSIEPGVPDRSVVIHNANHSFVLPVGTIVALVDRPWPEGKTEEDMRNWLRSACRRANVALDPNTDNMPEHIDGPVSALAELREALDAYDLGKPEPDPMIPVGRVPFPRPDPR